MSRRPLGLPITLAIIMIVLLVALIVGWILLAVFTRPHGAALFWTMLALGLIFLATVLAGVIVYMILTIKAINLGQRQSNFIDSVTHELKSPIASLKLYVQTLSRMELSRQDQVAFYNYMLDDVERLDHLINHLLEAGRLEQKSDPSDNEDVRLDELLRESAAAVCNRHRLLVETVSLNTAPCVVQARKVDLEMIFQNLIDNAIKYGGQPAQVDVSSSYDKGPFVIVQVSDRGPGIPHRLRRKVFGRFVRLGVELERKTKGTGLGLYIVGTLVKRLKGKVSIRDRDDGPGCTFEVRLPAAPAEAPATHAGAETRKVG